MFIKSRAMRSWAGLTANGDLKSLGPRVFKQSLTPVHCYIGVMLYAEIVWFLCQVTDRWPPGCTNTNTVMYTGSLP